jgi:hypothetical protein
VLPPVGSSSVSDNWGLRFCVRVAFFQCTRGHFVKSLCCFAWRISRLEFGPQHESEFSSLFSQCQLVQRHLFDLKVRCSFDVSIYLFTGGAISLYWDPSAVL